MEKIIVKSDKQMLVDWYFQMVADSLGRDAELTVRTGEVYQPEISGPLVEKSVVFRSKV